MKWINRLYIFFVGIILTTTTGFGIAAFYPEPVRPQYPLDYSRVTVPQSCYETPQSQNTPECQKIILEQQGEQQENIDSQRNYEKEQMEFNNTNAGYTRTAIFLGISIGALFAIIGIGLIRFSPLVANGIILGGVLTAITTRLLISLASLGSGTTGTAGADSVGYIQFGILTLLSVAVLFVGFTTLHKKDTSK